MPKSGKSTWRSFWRSSVLNVENLSLRTNWMANDNKIMMYNKTAYEYLEIRLIFQHHSSRLQKVNFDVNREADIPITLCFGSKSSITVLSL
jgi:hypothetical protein